MQYATEASKLEPAKQLSLKGANSFPDGGSYEYDQIRVSLCLLFRFIELYRVVYFSVSFGFVCYFIC